MNGLTILHLLAAVSALTLIVAALRSVRQPSGRIIAPALFFCLAVAVWAVGASVLALGELIPAIRIFASAAWISIASGQIVLVSTIFWLTFNFSVTIQNSVELFKSVISLFTAAALVAVIYDDRIIPNDLAWITSLFIPLAAFLASASVVRILLSWQFLGDVSNLALLVSAGAITIYSLPALANSGNRPENTSSLLLIIVAATGAALLRAHPMRSAHTQDEGTHPLPRKKEQPDQTSENAAHKPAGHEALSAVVSELPEILFTNQTGSKNISAALRAVSQPPQAARVSLFLNEVNAQGLLSLSLQDSWAAANVRTRQNDPQLQRLPYTLSTLAEWESKLADGQAVLLTFETVQNNDTLISPQTRSILLLPTHAHQHWTGLLTLEHFEQPYRWSEREIRLLLNAARLFALTQLPAQPTERQEPAGEVKYQESQQEQRSREKTQQTLLDAQEKIEQEAQKRLRQLQALNETANILLSTLDLETLLGRVLDAANQAVPGAEKGTLHLIAPETGQLEMRAVLGFSDPRIQKHLSRARRGLLDTVITHKMPVLIADLQDENGVNKDSWTGLEADTRSVIAAPLIADQAVYGALYLAASHPNAFNETDLHLVSGFATTATLAIRNAQLHEKVQKMAITDQLTTLYNRRGFNEFGERLFESARRFRHSLAIIALDIDFFKAVNDTHGHIAGDLVLQQLGEIMLRKIRKVDLVARVGGDEFTILLPETDVFQAMQVSERLRKGVEETRMVTGKGEVGVTISLGVSRMSTRTATLEALMDWADHALYEAKQAGRNRVRMYPLETPMPDLLPPEAPQN